MKKRMIEPVLKQCKIFNNTFDSEERLFRLSRLTWMFIMLNTAMDDPHFITYEVRDFKFTHISFGDEHYILDNGEYRLI